MKRVVSILLVIVLLSTVFVLPSSAASYPLGSIYNPVEITFGENYSAGWNGNDDHLNYYMLFEIEEKGLVTFEFTKPYDSEGEIGAIEFHLYDADGNYVWKHTSTNEKDNPKSYTSYTVGLEAGEYLMNVIPGFYVTSGYIDFSYNFSFNATKYCEVEPNNTIAEATPINLGNFYKGAYGTSAFYEDGADEFEFFKFWVNKGVKYRVRFKNVKKLTASTTIMDVIMNGEEVDFYGLYNIENRYDGEGYAYTDFVAPSTGYAYLKFDNYFGTPIEYEVEVSEIPVKCSKPILKTISNTEYGVKITWGKVTGADSYRIYRKTSGGSWKYLDSTKNTYFTDKTAKSGTKYYYAIRAKNGAGLSDRSSSLSKLYLDNPTLETPTSTSKGVGLRWSKVAGAQGYMVYRKTSGGSYTRIATEKGVSNLVYRDTTAKKGTKYYYKVKAYYSKTYSAFSNTKSITDKY